MPVKWTEEDGSATYYHDSCAQRLDLAKHSDPVDPAYLPEGEPCSACKKPLLGSDGQSLP
jgi:hypothetical protein